MNKPLLIVAVLLLLAWFYFSTKKTPVASVVAAPPYNDISSPPLPEIEGVGSNTEPPPDAALNEIALKASRAPQTNATPLYDVPSALPTAVDVIASEAEPAMSYISTAKRRYLGTAAASDPGSTLGVP